MSHHACSRPLAARWRALALASACVLWWAPSPALAQGDEEIICDPENPACQAPEPEAEPAPEVEAGGEEIICDPENPSCQAGPSEEAGEVPSGGDEESICDPENPSCQAGEEAPQGELVTPTLIEPDLGDEPAAIDASFRGSWGTSLAIDTQWQGGGEDIVELGSGLDLELSYEPSAQLRVVMGGELRHWIAGKERASGPNLLVNAEEPRAEYVARLGESYVNWRPGRLTLRVGQLTTRWGSTDLTRPGDVINARDSRSFGMVGPSAGDGVLAHPAAELGWAGASWSLTGVFVPFFVPDQVVLFGRDIALAGADSPLAATFPVAGFLEDLLDPSTWDDAQGLLWSPTLPDERPRSVSAGARAAATLWNTDLGLGYFFGWDRTPWVYLDEEAAELAQIIASDEQFLEDLDFVRLVQRHPEVLRLTDSLSEKQAAGEEVFVHEYMRRHTLVFDVARYIGPIGVRADVALSPAQNFTTESLGTVRRPTMFGALGLSYERVDGERQLGVTLEGFWLRPAGRDARVTEVFVEEARRGAPGQEPALIGAGLHGVAGGVVWDVPWIDTTLQIGGVFNTSTRDFIGRASARRGITEGLDLTLGAAIFEGPDPSERLTLGGLYDRNDQAYLGLEGAF